MDSKKFYSSTLFPEPSTTAPTSYRKRKYRDDRDDEISAFGYESKIYNNKSIAIKVDSGSYLIPWRSRSDFNTLMDRYDVRHLVEDQELFRIDQKAILEQEYDKGRYEDLEYNENIDGNKSQNKAAIPFNYVNDEEKKTKLDEEEPVILSEVEKAIMIKYKTPRSMIVPRSREQIAIIEATSKEISSAASNSNLIEIRIQVKNASNPLYSFLNKQDVLYPFYKHLSATSISTTITKNAAIGSIGSSSTLVAYSDSESDVDEEEQDPPSELKQMIIKTAEFIAKSNNSYELEHHIRSKKGNDPNFNFLYSGNVYYNYFKSQIKKHISK